MTAETGLIWLQSQLSPSMLAVLIGQLESSLVLSIPFVTTAALCRHSRWRWGLGFAAVLACLWIKDSSVTERLMAALSGLVYYCAAGVLVFRAERWVASGVIERSAWFAGLFALLVFIPATFFSLWSAIPMLVFGWHMTLSAYSYGVDAHKANTQPDLGACLFFLMVDPTLSFPERAAPSTAARAPHSAVRRIVLGVGCMTLAGGLLRVLPALAAWIRSPGPWHLAYLQELALALVVFLAVYGLRAGFAHVQIGLTRLLGYEVGECFLAPYLARSPLDFWRRWNVYVGDWARRYIFTPLSLKLMRARRRSSKLRTAPRVVTAIAVVVTFAFVGLLHDALNFAGEARTSLVHLWMFLFGAVALLIWEGLATGLRRFGRPTPPPRDPPWLRWISQVYMLHYWVVLVQLSGAIG